MENLSIAIMIFTALVASFLIWYSRQRYQWFRTVMNKNPLFATLRPIIAATPRSDGRESYGTIEAPLHLIAPKADFRQYLKYLYLACLPYIWSTPIKVTQEYWSRLFKCKLSMEDKRRRLAKMVLETSLVLLFEEKTEDGRFRFGCQNCLLPSKEGDSYHVKVCEFYIGLDEEERPMVLELSVNGDPIESIDSMFAFLNTLWCVYTHTLTHIEAGNIAELNIKDVKDNESLTLEFKSSIDDMHSAVTGMNESANHYPADIWGISRKNLQIVLGYNSHRQIHNHRNIVQCIKISDFVAFSMKARRVFQKHLSHTGVSISTLSANTLFHSIDHYNIGKYMIHEQKRKTFLGIDARMITTLLGRLNYDFGRWQGMQYTKYATWRAVYLDLHEIDPYLADKVHMFVSV